MAFDLTTLATDEAEITAELPATLAFANETVIGMSGPEMLDPQLMDEGFSDRRDIEFRVLISRFSTPKKAPYPNQTFTHTETGKQYRVQRVQTDTPANLSYILTCVERN